MNGSLWAGQPVPFHSRPEAQLGEFPMATAPAVAKQERALITLEKNPCRDASRGNGAGEAAGDALFSMSAGLKNHRLIEL